MSTITGTITKAISFTATAATLKTYTLTINVGDHVTCTVRKGSASGTVLSSGATVSYGDKLYISYTTDEGYIAGMLTVSGLTENTDGSYSVTGTPTITMTSGTANTYTVTITQSENQTIHVYVPSKAASNAVDHTSTFTATYGTTYEAEVVANTGYTAGTLSVN